MDEINIHKIIRSSRRTLALVITPDARLLVRAPFLLPEQKIRDFIRKKINWVRQKQAIAQSQAKSSAPKQYINGDKFWVLGQLYPLKIIEEGVIRLTDALEFPSNLLPQAKAHLLGWYKAQAQKVISERARSIAKSLGMQYSSARVNSAMKRWGSCGPKGTLNFSWRLVMAPWEVIDYVVTHEIVHLSERNHSMRFWGKVKSAFTGYAQCKDWLNKHGHLLVL